MFYQSDIFDNGKDLKRVGPKTEMIILKSYRWHSDINDNQSCRKELVYLSIVRRKQFRIDQIGGPISYSSKNRTSDFGVETPFRAFLRAPRPVFQAVTRGSRPPKLQVL